MTLWFFKWDARQQTMIAKAIVVTKFVEKVSMRIQDVIDL